MQVNRTGYLLFALFGLGGVAFLALGLVVGSTFTAGGATFLMIGGIWVAVTIGLMLYAVHQRLRGNRDQELFKTGLRGRGTIVNATVGMLVNEQPRMTLTLDVEIPGHEPRRVTRKLIVSSFAAGRMQPGLVLPVYTDPADPEDLLVVW